MGFFRFVKRSVLFLGLCGSMMNIGDRVNFNDRFVYPVTLANRQVESSFYSPLDVQRKIVINGSGNLETYLVSNGIETPVLQGKQGPILPMDYELRNLTQPQLYSAVVESWNSLSPEQKNVIAENEVSNLLNQRYQELESVLKDFFTTPGGGE